MAFARWHTVVVFVAALISTLLVGTRAVGVAQRKRHHRSGRRGTSTTSTTDKDRFIHPLHALGPVHSRLVPMDDPLPAVVVAPDLVVSPGDENDVRVSPTILDVGRPLHDDVEIQIPMDGRQRGAAAAAALGINEHTFAEMTTVQKIQALIPAANKEVNDQVEQVATLASDLFRQAKSMVTDSLTSRVQSEVETARLRNEVEAAKAMAEAKDSQVARLRTQLAAARTKHKRSLRAEADLQNQLNKALLGNTRSGDSVGTAVVGGGSGGVQSIPVGTRTAVVPTETLGMSADDIVCC